MPDGWFTPARRALLAGAACLAILIAMLAMHAWPLVAGDAIYLTVEPVDPRDLFRGDYVVLGYDLNTLRVHEEVGGAPAPGAVPVVPIGSWWREVRAAAAGSGSILDLHAWRDTVLYVQLEETPSSVAGVPAIHRAVSVSDVPQPGRVNLRGLARSLYVESAEDDPGRPVRMTMHYGIDAFFVQEGRGRAIEEAIRTGEVHAIVAVTASGRARLRDLVIDGRRWSDRIRDAREPGTD